MSAKYNKVKWNKIRSASRTLGVGNVYMTFSSVTQLSPTLCDPMNRSTPGLPVHHQLPEFTQTQVHWVGDAIQPSHPLSSPFPPAPTPSQHQSLFQWVNSSHDYFMANGCGNSGNSDRLYFLGLQNHCKWWLQPWNYKALAPWKKSYDQLRQHIKKQKLLCQQMSI